MKSVLTIFLFASTLLFPLHLMAADPIGVLPFESEEKGIGERLGARILVDLARSKQLTLVERGQLKKALAEIALSQSGVVTRKEALQIGKQIGARYLVLGEVHAESGARTGLYEASMRVVKTETGVIIGADSTRGTADQISRQLGIRARQILNIYVTMDNPDSPYSILLKLNKGLNPTYKVGDKLILNFKVEKHSQAAADTVYLQLFSIDARGAMSMIYPNKFSPSFAVKIGQLYSLPKKSADFEWELIPPVGTESIQAIVTERPVDFFKMRKRFHTEAFPGMDQADTPRTYKAIKTVIKQEKLKDWSAERISYKLRKD